jgi:hypothetical protein
MSEFDDSLLIFILSSLSNIFTTSIEALIMTFWCCCILTSYDLDCDNAEYDEQDEFFYDVDDNNNDVESRQEIDENVES